MNIASGSKVNAKGLVIKYKGGGGGGVGHQFSS